MNLTLAIGALLLTPFLALAAEEGQSAPSFTIKSLEGRTISAENTRGKVVVLNFWATWCRPCREEMPALDKYYKEHNRDGLEVVAISIDDASDETKVRKFTEPYSLSVAMLERVKAEGYGRIAYVPLTFVIDRNGAVRKAGWTGTEKISAASLDKYVGPLLGTP